MMTHQHRTLPRIVVTTGAAALAIGLLTTGSVLYSTDNASAVTAPTFSAFSRANPLPSPPNNGIVGRNDGRMLNFVGFKRAPG